MTASKTNFVLIGIDTLRFMNLGTYGYPRNTSPFIDHLASEGLVFDNCIAPAIPTHPGFTTILSGVHPLRHGIVSHAGTRAYPDNLPWLPEILASNSYFTVAVDNLATTQPSPWFKRGFKRYADTSAYNDITAEEVNEKLEGVIPELKEKVDDGTPYFLFMHYWDTHTPYHPPSPFDKLFYKGDPRLPHSRDVAAAVHRVVEDLAQNGLMDDTVLMVLSDHGEGLGEHRIYYDHHGLYEQTVHVPLIVYGPGLVKSTRVDALCQHTDVAPTVLQLAGISYEKYGLDGANLLNLLDGSIPYSYVISMENTWQASLMVRTSRYKLITTVKEENLYGRPPGFKELYDLKKDPGETVNLADSDRYIVKEMDEKFQHLLKEFGGHNPVLEQPISLRTNPYAVVPGSRNAKIHKNVCNWTVPSAEELAKGLGKFKLEE